MLLLIINAFETITSVCSSIQGLAELITPNQKAFPVYKTGIIYTIWSIELCSRITNMQLSLKLREICVLHVDIFSCNYLANGGEYMVRCVRVCVFGGGEGGGGIKKPPS